MRESEPGGGLESPQTSCCIIPF